MQLGVEDLLDGVNFTSLTSWFVLARLIVLLGLVFQDLDNAEADRSIGQAGQYLNRLRNVFLEIEVVNVDHLLFGFLLTQRLLGGDQAEVVNNHEARQRDFLGLVVLVQEEVLTFLVGDVDGLFVLLIVMLEVQGDELSTFGGNAMVGNGDTTGVDVSVDDTATTTQTVGGFFQASGSQIVKQSHDRSLSFGECNGMDQLPL